MYLSSVCLSSVLTTRTNAHTRQHLHDTKMLVICLVGKQFSFTTYFVAQVHQHSVLAITSGFMIFCSPGFHLKQWKEKGRPKEKGTMAKAIWECDRREFPSCSLLLHGLSVQQRIQNHCFYAQVENNTEQMLLYKNMYKNHKQSWKSLENLLFCSV